MSVKVLLIDDDPDLLARISEAFQAAGFETLTAENGVKGVRLFAACRPDLVVTDIVMPEMDGIGVILAIRQTPSPIKIIAISGARLGRAQNYLTWAKRLGADEVLLKPFRLSEIVGLARRLLTFTPEFATCKED